MKHRGSSSRRQFLQSSALAAGSLCSVAWQPRPPGDRLRLGFVGLGGQGRRHLLACGGEDVAALCDLDPLALRRAAADFPRAALHADFRRMFDRERLDGLLVATPDHSHAVILGAAFRQGCPVFCADPLAHTVSEARALASLARHTGVVSQVAGCWIPPSLESEVIRRLRQGDIGDVQQVHAWTSGTVLAAPTAAHPPSRVDREAWMGPLLPRPLPSAFAPAAWREWWDFGGGTLAASGTPAMALIHRAMDLRAPSEISAEGPALHLQRCPEWLVSRWVFSRDAPASPLTVCWRHGVPPSRIELPADALSSSLPQGVLFCGAQGSLRVVPGRAWILRPGEPDLLLGSGTGEGGRIREWLSACRTGAATACGVVAASPVAECLLLGNVAFRTDRRLTWDARELAAPNLPEASEYIQHSYGPGWTI